MNTPEHHRIYIAKIAQFCGIIEYFCSYIENFIEKSLACIPSEYFTIVMICLKILEIVDEILEASLGLTRLNINNLT